jgi:hypothetical protein
VGLIGALAYLYGGSRVPSGQAPLQSLTTENLSGIQDSFNAADGNVRVLLLLSPT